MMDAVEAVGAVPTQPVLTVMAAWEAEEAAAWASEWLPCELMNVEHHPILQKVVRQPQPDGGVAIILHSTHAFARANPKAYGKHSSVAGVLEPELAAAAASIEDGVREQLWGALLELLPPPSASSSAASGLPPATMGPLLHRWGSAFSAPSQALLDLDEPAAAAHSSRSKISSGSCWHPDHGLAFCGDFVAPASAQRCHVEIAATSGLRAARHILDII